MASSLFDLSGRVALRRWRISGPRACGRSKDLQSQALALRTRVTQSLIFLKLLNWGHHAIREAPSTTMVCPGR